MSNEYPVPIGKPISLEEFKKLEHLVNWNEVHGRWGTEKLTFSDYYGDNIPDYLFGKVTHVWLYFEK